MFGYFKWRSFTDPRDDKFEPSLEIISYKNLWDIHCGVVTLGPTCSHSGSWYLLIRVAEAFVDSWYWQQRSRSMEWKYQSHWCTYHDFFRDECIVWACGYGLTASFWSAANVGRTCIQQLAIKCTKVSLITFVELRYTAHGSPLISTSTACDQVGFLRISLTGFRSCSSCSQTGTSQRRQHGVSEPANFKSTDWWKEIWKTIVYCSIEIVFAIKWRF